MDRRALLRDLVETPRPAGMEDGATEQWVSCVGGTDRQTDAYGNVRVSVSDVRDVNVGVFVHTDVVGYTVRHVTDDGFVYVQRLGGVDPSLARGKRVEIHGRNGPVPGVFGSRSFHLVVKDDSRDSPEIEDVWIDVGATDRESVTSAGVHVGAPVTHAGRLEELRDGRLSGVGLDNAAGVAVVADALADCSPDNVGVHGVALTQTEIQHFGAKYFRSEVELDAAVVVDVTFAAGTPPIEERRRGGVTLGDGPVVRHNREHHPQIVSALERAADRADVSLQHEPVDTKGGERRTVYETTDAAYLAKQLHVPVGFVGIPCRYIHGSAEIVDRRDLDQVVSLLRSFLGGVTPAALPG